MRYAVAGVYHLYFGDASRHPIVGNYMRSVPDLAQQIVLTDVPASRLTRLWRMCRELLRVRGNSDWALQCHDFVAAVIGVVVWKGRVIYDSHEIYSSFARRRWVAAVINWLENFAIRRASITVFPSRYRSECYKLEGRDIRIVENLYYPYDDAPPESARDSVREQRLFVYTGLFTPARAVDDIIEAFRSPRLRASRLVLAGKRTNYLESLLTAAPDNVEYVGELAHEDVTRLLAKSDAGFALYRPVNENNRRCAPTKIFEFLYFGLHVIANRSPYVDEIKQRPAGDRISSLATITPQAIIDACEKLEISREPVSERERSAVCWESQMSVVTSLYC